ncbi:MAG TPA: hypothetical protein DCX05_04280 [Prevotella sp.]|nr:hypothetical protein [Prevotella sp.]
MELARKSERKWLRTLKFKGLCESIQIQQGCHIIILTDKYYVEANTEILFTKPSGIPINREVDGGEEWVKSC